jgi:hypothetical protein
VCDCAVDAPFLKIQRRRFPIAVKAHRCNECRRTIQIGEQHVYYFMVNDEGYTDELRECRRCYLVRRAHFAAEPECVPVAGDLLDSVRSCIGADLEYLKRFQAAHRKLRAA